MTNDAVFNVEIRSFKLFIKCKKVLHFQKDKVTCIYPTEWIILKHYTLKNDSKRKHSPVLLKPSTFVGCILLQGSPDTNEVLYTYSAR